MQQPLPFLNFRFPSEDAVLSFDVERAVPDTQQGVVLEVHLEKTRELRSSHCSFRLASEKLVVPYKLFSPYLKQLVELIELVCDG
ncbi:hypothetical protein HPB48_022150 [Haemaphysalis longicornis]|uniref:Uncharacterized protein n=1 Tax=Haemaphysalis longicornis TaxID=44386 RepID=A0A9J6FQY5_HAELO|nr:hypothetical protein HPB48_022150 [Haemaphysalis longicornis]